MNRDSYLRYSGHLGAILFNIGIVGVVFVAGAVFLPVLWAIAIALLILIAIYATALSAGLIWAWEFFRNFMGSSFNALLSDGTTNFLDVITTNAPAIMIVTGIVLAVASLFLFFDRGSQKSKSRLITIAIIAVVFVILVIIFVSGSIGGAA